MILYLTYWFPSARRAKMVALFVGAVPLSGMLGAPLSGTIISMSDGLHGLTGWQWMFIIEAIPSLVLGLLCLKFLDDRPSDANWLSKEEKAAIEADLEADREKYAKATLVAYDDTPFAFTALRNGNVQAISQDGPKLVGLLATIKDPKERDKWEVPAFTISSDYIGVGIPKDETALTAWVNTTLKELEAGNQAGKIYDTWFGPRSSTPLVRNFKIGDKS